MFYRPPNIIRDVAGQPLEGETIIATAKKISNILAVPFSLLSRGKITFPEFLEELEELEVTLESFGPEIYRVALEKYLGIRIEIVFIDDLEYTEVQQIHVGRNDTTICWYRPEKQCATIFVLNSLPELELTAGIYHELSHLAAGHKFISGTQDRLRLRGNATIPTQLAKQPPPSTRRAREREARIREDYCVLAGALGEDCLNQEQLRQVQ